MRAITCVKTDHSTKCEANNRSHFSLIACWSDALRPLPLPDHARYLSHARNPKNSEMTLPDQSINDTIVATLELATRPCACTVRIDIGCHRSDAHNDINVSAAAQVRVGEEECAVCGDPCETQLVSADF